MESCWVTSSMTGGGMSFWGQASEPAQQVFLMARTSASDMRERDPSWTAEVRGVRSWVLGAAATRAELKRRV